MATNLSTINLQSGLFTFLPDQFHKAVQLAVHLIEECTLAEAANWFSGLSKADRTYALTLTDCEAPLQLGLRLARKDDEIISNALMAFRHSSATCRLRMTYHQVEMLCNLIQFKYGLNKVEGSWDWMDVATSALPALIEGHKQAEVAEDATEVPEAVVADLAGSHVVVRSNSGMYHRGYTSNTGTSCTWDGQVRRVHTRKAGTVEPEAIRPNTVCKRCFKGGVDELAKFAGRTGQLAKGGAR